ncbi:restriction endonuclease subunit S [Lactobacillus helveticus]|uniref:restriction endonuclease subunit S n=1 Tax=Lactobacillus helveticus TaxID=1587 RepID=UPI001C1E5901|nr:restriction endonuclease subunit S [Lactobacillus helveticus]MBU5981073.1 restriction endonuclease subunit S [Lactobacillus helveticus]MCT3414559.1 restriction endonuclease subunit S [Lactobacillus helveticus]
MNKKEVKKAPALRFKGFTNDWEDRQLSDIADRFDNLRVPITASDRKPGDTPYYGANGIQDYVEGFTHNGEFILVAEDGANDLKNYPVQYVNGKVWVNNHAHVLQGKKTITDNKFLMNAIKNFNIEPFLVGGGRAKLNADVMMKLNILLPTFVEQEKIGSLFSLLDKTISLQQRKLDLLKEQKKGYLQKMFPKNGAKVPELRFAGFADDWEERKLGEVSKYSNGGSYENDVVENGTYELITLKSVNMSGKLVSSGKFINRETKTLEKDTLVMILSEQAPGLLGMTAKIPENNRYVLNQRVAEIKPNTNIDSYFLSMSINRSQAYFSKRGAGTKVKNISKPNVENFEFYCPSEREQQKIGSFFKHLDDTIALHQRKLDLLKEQKKGFLQKMFV